MLSLIGFSLSSTSDIASDPQFPQFERFIRQHRGGTPYGSEQETIARFTIFKDTLATIDARNAVGKEKHGVTKFADLTPAEFKAKHTGLAPTTAKLPKKFHAVPGNATNTASVNWCTSGACTPIKNQGQCGSCWAFSATEAVESQMILGTGSALATALSPQQVASCTPATGTYGCMGCEGGFTEGAYEYLKTAPGLANSFFIPYEQSLTEQTATAACPTTKVQAITGELEQLQGGYAQVTGYSYAVPPCTGTCSGASQDLAKFAQALETTPLSVCVNAENWNDYTGGVMSAAACGPSGAQYQDHCVMATGFNTTAPTPYWIVRNSWASTWGEEGYVYLEMSKNTCGLADDATIPHVKLDLTPEQEAKAAARREAMYQRATMAH